jgi:hypothetical protein
MFIAALFTRAKQWNQPTCPTTNKWVKKIYVPYIHHGVPFSHKEEGGIGVHQVEQDKPSLNSETVYVFTHMWNSDLK